MKIISKFCAAENSTIPYVNIVSARTAETSVHGAFTKSVDLMRTKIEEPVNDNCAFIQRISFFRNVLEVRYDEPSNLDQGFLSCGLCSEICRSLSPHADEEENK